VAKKVPQRKYDFFENLALKIKKPPIALLSGSSQVGSTNRPCFEAVFLCFQQNLSFSKIGIEVCAFYILQGNVFPLSGTIEYI
jgi:hypothetical protein